MLFETRDRCRWSHDAISYV